jgi:AraC-like DNA-binding protein
MKFFDGVNFVCCGSMANNPAPHERIFPDYYGIQYSQDGEFVVEMGSNYKRTVSGSWALITRPGPRFRYGPPPGKERLHAFVCFKGSRVNEYIKSGLLPVRPRNPLIKITRPERFLETLNKLVLQLQPLTAAKYPRAVHLLEDLMLQLHEQPAEAGPFPEYLRQGFLELVTRIKEAPELIWDFNSEAEDMNISYPHFRRLFRQHSGMPPGKFLSHARLRKAAHILISSDMQIESVAESCGFEDNFYFSRLFKKYYHFSPMHYRKEFRP